MSDFRPNPESLLQTINKLDEKNSRGKLRVFIGMCAGVGKTYAMLKAAKVQQERYANNNNQPFVLVGLVETHGRVETKRLLNNLQVLPRKEISYKDSLFYELDLDLVLQIRPKIVLVDELAHSNVIGSRNTKRYQDIEELLAAGIDVYTTVNIQHIESRNDLVYQITGVQVKETVPDSFLEKADQIEVIDIPPQELLHRLKEGKVYSAEQSHVAQDHFFREEHLTALRELCLRFTAEKVDQDLQDQMMIKGVEGPWQTNERLLVAVSYSPYSARLIRRTRSMAYSMEAPWIALYVNTGESLNIEDQQMLQKNIELAQELGAELVSVVDTDLVHAIQSVCLEKNVTQIIMGRPDRRFFKDLISQGTLLDRLVRTTKEFDVHVIRSERNPKYRGIKIALPLAIKSSNEVTNYLYTLIFLVAITILCWMISSFVGYQTLGFVYLLSILAIASISSMGAVFFAASLSAILWNFLFIAPTFTFIIHSETDVMMLFSFFVVALVGGMLTNRIKRQESILQIREERTRHLYEFNKSISDATSKEMIVDVLKRLIFSHYKGNCQILMSDKDGKLSDTSEKLSEKDKSVAVWTYKHHKPAGWSTSTLSASLCLCLPLKAHKTLVGVLVYYPDKDQKPFNLDQELFIDTAIRQASIAIERFNFSESIQKAKEYETAEKIYQTIINSVSHELRTPITAIMGTASALKDPVTIENKHARQLLTDELIHSTKRLDRVVENLLDMSLIETGRLQIKKEWFDLYELMNDVSTMLKDDMDYRDFQIMGNSSVLIEGNFRLLQHAFFNLFINALKYSPLDQPIEVKIQSDEQTVTVLIIDRGQGIPVGAEDHIFEKFYRLPNTPPGGLGLGLYIVKNIFELHDGRVIAYNRNDGLGAVFECKLPRKSIPTQLNDELRSSELSS